MKIDLHCHTKKVKKGDASTRTVTPDLFSQKVQEANIELIAITNHNAFDYSQYKQLKGLGVCKVWPGIELDAKGKDGDGRFHILIVCDPAKEMEFDKAVSVLLGNKDPDTFCTDLRTIISTFQDLRVIYIPHYADKKKAISSEDRLFLAGVIPNERLFLEPRNLRTLGIRAFSGDNAIIGSDVQDWASYEKCTFAELRLPVSTFEQLVLLAKRDVNVIKHLLDKKFSETITVSPAAGVEFSLSFYNDINIIFGEKGTGKSRILASINEYLLNQGRNPQYYEGSKREENLSALLDKSDMVQSASILGVENTSDQIAIIDSWEEPGVTLLKEYCNWYRTSGFDDAKVKMKIAKMTGLGVPDEQMYSETLDDLNQMGTITKAIKKVSVGKYLSPDDQAELRRILASLSAAVKLAAKKEFVKVESQNFANFTIEIIKALVAGNKGSIPIPVTTGFEEYACSRLKLANAVQTLKEGLETPPYSSREFLGPLDDKGNIYIVSTWSFWSDKSEKADYPRTGTKVSEAAGALRNCAKHSIKADYLSYVGKLKEALGDLEAKSLDCFVGTNRTIALESGEKYQPSNGEKGILLLRRALDSESSVYLIDEPELGMGNSFIEDSIRPKLLELSRQHRTVIVATHNANIAVRTLPYCTIYREHVGNNVYRTYCGNPFTDSLVDIDNPDNKKNWTETSLRTLEGGREAFDERGSIYDAADNQGVA